MDFYVNVLVTLAVLIVPVVLGTYLARALRMPDYGWKIWLILFVSLASAVVTFMQWPPKLGIDLSGGVILVYEVDHSKRPETLSKQEMDKLIGAVMNRVNPGGVKEVTIRPYGVDQVEVIIPITPKVDEDEANRIASIISRAGTLEFRILANRRNHAEVIAQAETQKGDKVVSKSGKLLGWWVPVQEKQEGSFPYPDIARRVVKVHGKDQLQILVVNDNYNVKGDRLTSSKPGIDRTGRPCVNFAFDSAGADAFARLTGDNLPDKTQNFTSKLGIILDGQLYSAPSIQSTISDHGEITGGFSQKEVEDLVNVLNAGSLPAALLKDPVSRLYSGPTLGRDTIAKSTNAMIVSSILVVLFMVWYYRFSGLVANIALVLNMLMLMAIMIAIHARFTLTGLAGLALTVGMAVDNNVLVYERLREEMERGATLRMAIRNAFQRATAVIVDSNLTTLLAATVLYVIGSDQVKGFAVTLWLGVAISMFTAVFVARVIFDIAEKQRWISKLKMLRLIGHTQIDFMGLFRYTATASVLITVVGILIAFHRGKGLFDIDFTGGTSVQAVFRQPQDIGEIREHLKNLPDIAVSDVRLSDEEPGLRYLINTSEPDLGKVERQLTELFGDTLQTNSLEVKGLEKVEAAKPASPSPKAQSRNDLPPDTLLASAEPQAMVLAQATKAAEKEPAGKPEAKAPTATIEEKGPAGKPEAKAQTAKPGEKAPAPAAKPAEEPKPPTEKVVNPFLGGTQADLTFGLKINHKTASELLTTAMQSLKIEPVPFELSNPEYQEGESAQYDTWHLKIQLPAEKAKTLLSEIQRQLKATPYFPASSQIGGAVASSTRVTAVYALIASWIITIIYLWVRFQQVAFGVAAVVALIHDVFVMLGAIALSYYIAPFFGFLLIDPFKINLPIVAAFLTIIGYSVNDTIVVFDRIREVRGKYPYVTSQIVNDSTNQTLSRTLLTSFTVFLVVMVLYLFGGEAVHGFAFALIVGVATGTYSSIYVAAPILLWMIGPPKGERDAATQASVPLAR